MNKSKIISLEEYWKEHFERYAKRHNEDHLIAGWSGKGLQIRINTFLKVFEKEHIPRNTLLLDLGCGGGTYTRLLTKMGYKVIGLDYSGPTIRKAISKDTMKKAFYIVGEAYHLPFKKDTFDSIVCIGVFQSLETEYFAIKEMDNVLKKNGVLFLDALNSIGILAFLKRLLKSIHINNNKLIAYNPYSLKKTYKNLGYGNINISGIYILPGLLSKLVEAFSKLDLFKIIDKIPFLLFLFSHAFILRAEKMR